MSNNVFLPSYSIGDNVYSEIDAICKSYGKKVIVIGGETAIEKSKNFLLDGLKNSNIEILDFLWFGSDATYENVERLKNNKKVSEKDNRYFEMAEKYLYNEMAIVLNMTPEDVRDYVIEQVSK